MRTILIGAAMAAAIAFTSPASADLFDFSYAGPGVTGSGTLTTTTTTTDVDGRQAYTITGITGTRNGATINLLYPAGTVLDDVDDETDNYLFADGPYLTFNGFAFGVAGGSSLFNPSYSPDDDVYFEYRASVATDPPSSGQSTTLTAFTLTRADVAPVPEVATWAMMIVGFGAAGAAMRRRARVTGVRFAAA